MKGCRADVANFVHSCTGGNSVGLWHRCLKKVNVRNVYPFQSIVRGMILSKTSHPTSTLVCEICMENKQYAAKWSNDAVRLALNP